MRISDWSSDVCSSDLFAGAHVDIEPLAPRAPQPRAALGERGGNDAVERPCLHPSLAQRRRQSGGRGAERPADFRFDDIGRRRSLRSEEHTSELQSLMRISYAVFCLTNKNIVTKHKQLTGI